MLKLILSASLGAGLLLSPVAASAAPDAVHTNWRNSIAADGMDVVSFFSGKPQTGKEEFTTKYKGADWYFISQANKDLFLANPEQFEPQYGGYCAWAAAKDKLAEGNPKYWTVEDGRLYFNYNARVQKRWDKNRAEFIQEADMNWPDLMNK